MNFIGFQSFAAPQARFFWRYFSQKHDFVFIFEEMLCILRFRDEKIYIRGKFYIRDPESGARM